MVYKSNHIAFYELSIILLFTFFENLLPWGDLHRDGRSGNIAAFSSGTHSRPSIHVPQVKLVDGLKQDPQASPSNLVPLSDIKDIYLRIEVSISGFFFYLSRNKKQKESNIIIYLDMSGQLRLRLLLRMEYGYHRSHLVNTLRRHWIDLAIGSM